MLPAGLILALTIGIPRNLPTELAINTTSLVYVGTILICFLGIITTRQGGAPGFPGIALSPILAPLVAGVFHPRGSEALVVAARPLLTFSFILAYAALAAKSDNTFWPRCAGLIALFGAVEGVLAALQTAGLGLGIYSDAVAYLGNTDGRASATLGHPILLGSLSGLGALCAINWRPRWWPLLLLLSFLGLTLSGSRGPWIAFLMALLILAFTMRKKIQGHGGSVLIGLTVVGAAATALILLAAPDAGVANSNLLSRFATLGTDTSSIARATRLHLGLDLATSSVATSITGSGPDFTTNYLMRFGVGDTQALAFDNSYLWWWINFGLIGEAMVLLPVAAALLRRVDIPSVVLTCVIIAGFDTSEWVSIYALLGLVCGAAIGSEGFRSACLIEPKSTSPSGGLDEKDTNSLSPAHDAVLLPAASFLVDDRN